MSPPIRRRPTFTIALRDPGETGKLKGRMRMEYEAREDRPTAGNDIAPASHNRRRYQRHTTVMQGRLFFTDTKADGIVLDVSLNGVKIKANERLPLGAPVTLAIAGSVYLGGEVIWRQGNIMGVAFAKAPEQIAKLMAAFLPVTCLRPQAYA